MVGILLTFEFGPQTVNQKAKFIFDNKLPLKKWPGVFQHKLPFSKTQIWMGIPLPLPPMDWSSWCWMNWLQVIIMVEAAGAASSSLQYPPLEKTNRDQLVSAKFSQRTLLAVTPLTLVIVILSVIFISTSRCSLWYTGTTVWVRSNLQYMYWHPVLPLFHHHDHDQVSYLLGSMAEHQQNIGLYGSFTTLSAVLGWVSPSLSSS